MRDNVASELFMINAWYPGKLKIEVIRCQCVEVISGVPKVVEEKKKERKNLKGVRKEQIEEVFSEMASWPAMVAA